jgi:hypothetical protein
MKCERVIVQIAEETLCAKFEIHQHVDETLKKASESHGPRAAVKRELFATRQSMREFDLECIAPKSKTGIVMVERNFCLEYAIIAGHFQHHRKSGIDVGLITRLRLSLLSQVVKRQAHPQVEMGKPEPSL